MIMTTGTATIMGTIITITTGTVIPMDTTIATGIRTVFTAT